MCHSLKFVCHSTTFLDFKVLCAIHFFLCVIPFITIIYLVDLFEIIMNREIFQYVQIENILLFIINFPIIFSFFFSQIFFKYNIFTASIKMLYLILKIIKAKLFLKKRILFYHTHVFEQFFSFFFIFFS